MLNITRTGLVRCGQFGGLRRTLISQATTNVAGVRGESQTSLNVGVVHRTQQTGSFTGYGSITSRNIRSYSTKVESELVSDQVRRESHSVQAQYVGVSVSEDRRNVTLTTEHGSEHRFNATWLRYHCRCSECWEPDSLQYRINPSKMPSVLSIKDINISDGELLIHWTEDDHKGRFPFSYLWDHTFSKETISKAISERIPIATKGHLPVMTYDDIIGSEKGLWDWVHILNDTGVCLVDKIQDGVSIKSIVQRIGQLQQQLYGDVFTVESSETPVNIAYTNKELHLHMDLLYYEAPPGFQFLKVDRFDDCIEGGESVLVDGWYEAERMRELHPEEFETLTRVPVTFSRVHSARDNPVHLLARRPHFRVEDGQILSLSWAPISQTLWDVDEEDIEPYYKAIHTFATMMDQSESKVQRRLTQGQLICFNNKRYLHGRSAFALNGGSRILTGCYVSSDDFKSVAEVLSKKYNDGKPAKRVFNNCLL